MSFLLYYLCIVLMLPVLGLAAFGLVIDSLSHFGFWACLKILFAPLYDPFGKGIWLILGLVSILGLLGAGLFSSARPFGFGAIALLSALFGIVVCRTYPDIWQWNSLLLFFPSLTGIAISVYCVVKPVR